MARSPARWFLVPDDAPWPDGPGEVRDVTGRIVRTVDLDALAPFALTSAEFRAWCQGERAALEARFAARRDAARARRQAAFDAIAGLDLDPVRDALAARGVDLADPAGQAELGALLEALTAALHRAEASGGATLAADLDGVLRAHGLDALAEQLAAGLEPR